MSNRIDLHTHTTASDGTLSPEELVALARERGLSTVAVTDHDTMAGIPAARAAAERLGVELIPGIEISTDYHGRDTHVLGYGLAEGAPELRPVLEWVQNDRKNRNRRIAAMMRADGIAVSLEELEREYPGATIGRPHFARLLVERGRAESVGDAFARWVGEGCPYYLPRTYLPLDQAVEVIRCCGGVAVLAHPLQYSYPPEELRGLVEYAAACGMRGMEVYYTGYGPEERQRLLALAREFGLFATGGSDFHGANKPEIGLGTGDGTLSVPQSALAALKRAMEQAKA